ncbi:MAG: hypothetical protein IKW83_11405 [Muribaculaceae bacterium]|nr:hypothetical protein [Muribaculaceae bacterium]
MFELNIEDFMADLEGLTIQEKVEKLDSLSSDLEDALQEALGDVDYAKQTLIDDYEKSVHDPLFTSVSELINKNHWEDSVTINKTRMGRDCFIVNTKPTSVSISTHWNQWDQWIIEINPTEFIASNTKRHETLSNLADRLNLPYLQGRDDISVKVEENELQPTVLRIITKLCEEPETLEQ